MTASTKSRKIDEALDAAAAALKKKRKPNLFAAEKAADQALRAARATTDYERMIKAVPLLQQARMGRLDVALDAGEVTILDTTISEDMVIEPGCYLIRPPLVGADSRRLRLAAFEAEVPIGVVCREPTTQLRLCPIVAICPGYTCRTQINLPDDEEHPDIAWFGNALVELGDWSLSTIDPAVDCVKRVDMIIDRLVAMPEHAALHDALLEACRECMETQVAQ
jgi:hypothetical protein